MRSTRSRLAAVLITGLALIGCSSTEETAPPRPATAPVIRPGGTIVIAADAEPPTFNPRSARANSVATRDVIRSVLPSVWSINERFEYVLDTDVAVSADVVSRDPFTIVYRLNPIAVWSDGVPVSAEDFSYVLEVQKPGAIDVDGKPITVLNSTENLITSVTGSDGGKTVTVVLREPFPDWKTLFLTPLVPAHHAKKVGFNTGLDDATTLPSAGPFRVGSHNKGRDLTLVRNERYWGTPAHLDSMVFRFVGQSTDTVAALRNREVDLITPRIQVDLKAQVGSIPGVRSEAVMNQQYEYLDFNLSNELLAIPAVRRAIALSLDRGVIVARTVGQLDPSAKVLNNRLHLISQKEYQDTSGGRYDKQDVAQARRLLEGAGFTPGADGIYARDGKRLTFDILSTAGDALRDAQRELMQAQARQAGIELKPVDAQNPQELSSAFLSGGFQIANVAQNILVASGTNIVFGTGSNINVTKYSNPRVDALYREARAELDDQKRVAIYNDIDRILWDDLPRLPLYQRPTVIAYRDRFAGISPSPALGVFWNTDRWGIAS